MLTHTQIWRGVDRLAQRAGLSASGLARQAGLDPTTFNPSKRISADGAQAALAVHRKHRQGAGGVAHRV